MGKYTRFQDIPQFTKTPTYAVDQSWDYLTTALEHYDEMGLNTDPDFQRAHVWTEAQQIAYVEYVLQGGASGRSLFFNHPNWMGFKEKKGAYKDFVLVDGKQRLTAALRFINNDLPAFGALRSEFTDKMRMTGPSFRFHVNDLKTRKQVLTWYLEMNTGGTPHTQEEIDKVRRMLDQEK